MTSQNAPQSTFEKAIEELKNFLGPGRDPTSGMLRFGELIDGYTDYPADLKESIKVMFVLNILEEAIQDSIAFENKGEDTLAKTASFIKEAARGHQAAIEEEALLSLESQIELIGTIISVEETEALLKKDPQTRAAHLREIGGARDAAEELREGIETEKSRVGYNSVPRLRELYEQKTASVLSVLDNISAQPVVGDELISKAWAELEGLHHFMESNITPRQRAFIGRQQAIIDTYIDRPQAEKDSLKAFVVLAAGAPFMFDEVSRFESEYNDQVAELANALIGSEKTDDLVQIVMARSAAMVEETLVDIQDPEKSKEIDLAELNVGLKESLAMLDADAQTKTAPRLLEFLRDKITELKQVAERNLTPPPAPQKTARRKRNPGPSI